MDIRTMTVGQLLNNPKAVAVLKKHLPNIINHPLIHMAKDFKVGDIINNTSGYIPKFKLNQIMKELEDVLK